MHFLLSLVKYNSCTVSGDSLNWKSQFYYWILNADILGEFIKRLGGILFIRVKIAIIDWVGHGLLCYTVSGVELLKYSNLFAVFGVFTCKIVLQMLAGLMEIVAQGTFKALEVEAETPCVPTLVAVSDLQGVATPVLLHGKNWCQTGWCNFEGGRPETRYAQITA